MPTRAVSPPPVEVPELPTGAMVARMVETVWSALGPAAADGRAKQVVQSALSG